jgi:threonyl-tRNA synthetase
MEKNKLDVMRHSCSHLLAAAVMNLYPDAKMAIGPNIENGFYYDFEFTDPISNFEFKKIEIEMRRLKNLKSDFIKKSIPKEEARELFKSQPYKLELIDGITDEEVSTYETGDFVDLCAGPHVKNTSDIGNFQLLNIAGAYWRGDEKNKMLTRIYGTCFETKEELDKYLWQMEEAKKRDHKKLGKELDLFSMHDEAPGMAIVHPKGMVVWNEIVNFWRKIHLEQGYVEIKTPIILNNELWHQSGHWDHYKDNMYFTKIDDVDYAIKPMNCPGGILHYKTNPHSYRELPIKVAEIGLVHRHELSGVLSGLFRVRSFHQDDAHIYCTDEQLEQEIENIINLENFFYKKIFNFEYRVELSTRPEKAMGDQKLWEKAEIILEKILKKTGIEYKINPGDGAFYGPKIDFHIKDAIGRSWQCGTIQLDFQMPAKFNIEYEGMDGAKHQPIMLHRTILGSLERFMGILIEHYAGAFPVWLSPVQISILPISERFNDYAKKIKETFESQGLRVKLNDENKTLGAKIRETTLQKVPYMCIIGEKECSLADSVSIRHRDGKTDEMMNIYEFIKEIKAKIENKS